MTTVNRRGGYYKSLEINREGSASSNTVLKDTFLKKAEGYVCQVTRFVVNNTPPLNLIDEDMITVQRRGNAAIANVLHLNDTLRILKPGPYRTWLELARKIEEFCDNLNTHFQQASIEFRLLGNGWFQLKLYGGFTTEYYLEFGTETQKYTGLKQYMFVVQDNNGNIHTQENGNNYLLAAGNFNPNFPANVTSNFVFMSGRSLSAFDHRLYHDVVAFFPIANIVTFLDGIESHEFVLARFPLSDYKEIHNVITVSGGVVQQSKTMQETVNLGLEDLCRNNTLTVTTTLLPGELRHCNFRLETVYLSDGKIIRVPSNMDEGFWSLKILFSKKET